ncbi:sulfatase-like hydrolase/transferase [Chitinophaga sp. MM2321]|uniref:sulfatase family protein n=1 Tax=Chitinophaga sp. MM2321 TaxID=3137178 RepID=UPI0032D57031
MHFCPTKKKPNILVILTDDLGYHDVSYYGTPDIRTPNIDNLCKAGIRFDNFYANSPVCSPTRAALLSGRYPEMVGVPGLVRYRADDNFGFLMPDAMLLPKLLKQEHYHTAIIGKWNLGLETPNTPNEKGFDFFHGFLDDMMEDYSTHLRHGKNFMRENQQVVNPKGHATDIFTEWAVDYIHKQSKSQDPFFLYLAYNAPHTPIQPPAEWLAKVKVREPHISEKRAKLVALIEHLDDGVGKVIQALKERGLYENTLIVFLSDNGGELSVEANNGALRGGKGSMYEGGIRVPAFLVWANEIKAGAVSTQLALTMDIYPTISEITGASINHSIDGQSLLPILKKPSEKLAERPVFFIRREGNRQYGGQTIQAVIADNWKLLQNTPYGPYELYHLSDDPLEKHNLITSQVDQHRSLQHLLMKQIQKGGSVPWQKTEND